MFIDAEPGIQGIIVNIINSILVTLASLECI